MKKSAIVCSLVLLVLSAVIAFAVAPDKVTRTILHKGPGVESGVITATANAVTTTVNKNVYQTGLQFYPMSLTISGSQAPYAELSVPSGGSITLVDGIGNVTAANLQMLYIATDSLDCTLSLSSGTTLAITAGSASVKQGTPYEWDTSSAANGFTDWKSLSITAGTSGSLSGGTAAATSVHIRSSLSN